MNNLSPIMLVLIVLLIVFAVGSGPWWTHSRGWGYGPSGLIGVILVIILVLALLGKI
jgi:hypothetical protein